MAGSGIKCHAKPHEFRMGVFIILNGVILGVVENSGWSKRRGKFKSEALYQLL